MKNGIIAILLVVSFGLLFFLLKKEQPETITEINTVIIPGDTAIKWKIAQIPTPYKVIETDTVYLPSDSVCIEEYIKLSKSFYKLLIYNDTLQDDSLLLAGVVDTVYQNKLWGRSFFYQNRKPTAIITTINKTVINNNGLFVGISNNNVGLSLVKNKFIFDVGYSYDNKIIIGAKYKIFK